jgi:hypothetical protein
VLLERGYVVAKHGHTVCPYDTWGSAAEGHLLLLLLLSSYGERTQDEAAHENAQDNHVCRSDNRLNT